MIYSSEYSHTQMGNRSRSLNESKGYSSDDTVRRTPMEESSYDVGLPYIFDGS